MVTSTEDGCDEFQALSNVYFSIIGFACYNKYTPLHKISTYNLFLFLKLDL